MPTTIEEPLVLPEFEITDNTKSKDELDAGYLVICWDDPVNLMQYVTHVFQKVFGWTKEKAKFHMMQVHKQGKSVLARENFEKAEHYVHRLQQYKLHATLERDK